LLALCPRLAKIVRIVSRGTINEVTGRGMQTPVTRVHLDVHHIPALEVNITYVPSFTLLIAFKDEAALLCSNEDQDFLTHKHLLSVKQNKCSNHSIISAPKFH
jgi:hypothetical protein